MKSWFVYLINGIRVGTWANNTDEAERNLASEYGNVPMEFVGICFGKIGPQPDKLCHKGMTGVDSMIAFGMANVLVGLRYS